MVEYARLKEMRAELTALFKKNGYSITEISRGVGVTYHTIRNFLQGASLQHNTYYKIDAYLKSKKANSQDL